ncbi:MAG: hypothetical protein WCJ33_00025 [Pseudomonadota bacterium]
MGLICFIYIVYGIKEIFNKFKTDFLGFILGSLIFFTIPIYFMNSWENSFKEEQKLKIHQIAKNHTNKHEKLYANN